nr:unnamed protein product [Digitaria exilis]
MQQVQQRVMGLHERIVDRSPCAVPAGHVPHGLRSAALGCGMDAAHALRLRAPATQPLSVVPVPPRATMRSRCSPRRAGTRHRRGGLDEGDGGPACLARPHGPHVISVVAVVVSRVPWPSPAPDTTATLASRCPASSPSRRAVPAAEPPRGASPRSRTHSCAVRWLAHANAHAHTRTREPCELGNASSVRSPAFGHAVAACHRTPGRRALGATPRPHGAGHTALAVQDRCAAAADPWAAPRVGWAAPLWAAPGPWPVLAQRPSRARGAALTAGAHQSQGPLLTSSPGGPCADVSMTS